MENLLQQHLKLIKWFKIKKMRPTVSDVICEAVNASKTAEHFKNDSHTKQLWKIHTCYLGFGAVLLILLVQIENKCSTKAQQNENMEIKRR